jgi:transcriptional regulator with XRE-family HTH domain
MAQARQASAPGQAGTGMTGTVSRLSVASGRTGFKAELEDLRERMRGLAMGHEQIAGEIARRYRARPREAYRLAHGWTLGQAAARFNARAAELGTDRDGLAGLAPSRLCEYEKWPHSERRPSVYVLVMLAQVYQASVLSLLDLADHEHLPPQDRLALAQTDRDTSQPETPPPGLTPGPPRTSAGGMSLSLPWVPARLVIEIAGPALSTGPCGSTVQAVPEPVLKALPAATTLIPASYGGRA